MVQNSFYFAYTRLKRMPDVMKRDILRYGVHTHQWCSKYASRTMEQCLRILRMHEIRDLHIEFLALVGRWLSDNPKHAHMLELSELPKAERMKELDSIGVSERTYFRHLAVANAALDSFVRNYFGGRFNESDLWRYVI